MGPASAERSGGCGGPVCEDASGAEYGSRGERGPAVVALGNAPVRLNHAVVDEKGGGDLARGLGQVVDHHVTFDAWVTVFVQGGEES